MIERPKYPEPSALPPQNEAERLENKEQNAENREHRTVARVFVLQSRSFDFLQAQVQQNIKNGQDVVEAITSTSLTDVLWLEKGAGARNEGQLMPIGGGRQPNDSSLIKTAARELLEETHLRPINITQLQTREAAPVHIAYEMRLRTPDSKDPEHVVDNNQYFFAAEILPSDRPYPLNPEEDKIITFRRLDVAAMGDLWAHNKTDDGQRLLDSLQIEPKDMESKKIKITFPEDRSRHSEQIWHLMDALGTRVRAKEIHKLRDVVREIMMEIRLDNMPDESVRTQIEQAIAALNGEEISLPEAQMHYQQIIKVLATIIPTYLKEIFFNAVERTNIREELRNPGNSQIEAAIRFAYLYSKHRLSFDEFQEIIQQELESRADTDAKPDVVDLFAVFQKIAADIQLARGKNAGLRVSKLQIEHELRKARHIPKEELEQIFTAETGVRGIPGKLARIQKFIQNMVEQGLIKGTEQKLDEAMVSPLTTIANADLPALCTYAFSSTDDSEISKLFKSPESQQRLRFEALRTLCLLLTFEPINREYERVVNLGNQKIEELWSELLIVDEKSQRLVVSSSSSKEEVPERFMRRFKTIPGLYALQNVRQKQVDSLYRKVIVRGFDDPSEVRDIYGRILVLAANTEIDRQRFFTRVESEVTTENAAFELGKGIVFQPETKIVKEFPAVLAVIESLQRQGAHIVDYDPTNLPGQEFSSAGPGGGSAICLAKFYIGLETKGRNGGLEQRFEEVQIFSPTEDGQSGFQNKEHKQADDQKYSIKRLTDTRGLRSFIELMFPAKIYGDPMRAAYRKKNHKKEK